MRDHGHLNRRDHGETSHDPDSPSFLPHVTDSLFRPARSVEKPSPQELPDLYGNAARPAQKPQCAVQRYSAAMNGNRTNHRIDGAVHIRDGVGCLHLDRDAIRLDVSARSRVVLRAVPGRQPIRRRLVRSALRHVHSPDGPFRIDTRAVAPAPSGPLNVGGSLNSQPPLATCAVNATAHVLLTGASWLPRPGRGFGRHSISTRRLETAGRETGTGSGPVDAFRVARRRSGRRRRTSGPRRG